MLEKIHQILKQGIAPVVAFITDVRFTELTLPGGIFFCLEADEYLVVKSLLVFC